MTTQQVPTAKKVRGEYFWLPAVKGLGGPVPIAWTKHRSASAATTEAKRLLSPTHTPDRKEAGE